VAFARFSEVRTASPTDRSTFPAVDHLPTLPLRPATLAPAPGGAIPAQRGPEPARPETSRRDLASRAETERREPSRPEPSHPEPSHPEPPRPVPNGRLFVGAAVLTGCALVSSIWAAAVTSTSGPGRQPASPVSALSAPAGGAATARPAPVGAAAPTDHRPVPDEIGGEGIYGVGAELQPGTYRTTGPSPAAFDNCYWERSRDTSGQPTSVIASGVVSGPFTVTIKRTDRAFKTSGCQAWTKLR